MTLTWIAKTITIFVLSFFLLKLAPPVSVSSVLSSRNDSFTVSGEGKVSEPPNLALVNIGIQTGDTSPEKTQAEANRVLENITKALTTLGIPKKDIKTTGYYLNPVFDPNVQPTKISGYTLNSSLEVRVSDFDKLNQVIDTSIGNGANIINGVVFTFDDKKLREIENQAREKAVDDAKQKAQDLAKISGLKLGKLINVSENFPSYPSLLKYPAREFSGDQSLTDIKPGEKEIAVSILLTYETR